MRILRIDHKGQLYEFRLMELASLIQVIKGIDSNPFATPTYYLFRVAKGWSCTCPGSRFHHHCWHHKVVPMLENAPRVKEPWAEWAERSLLEKCGKVIRN